MRDFLKKLSIIPSVALGVYALGYVRIYIIDSDLSLDGFVISVPLICASLWLFKVWWKS